ncbi:YwiC-like family protein [Georgenia sp.]
MSPAHPTRRRRRGPGWVPDQHGAWAMITVPPLIGIALGGPAWVHLPLLGLWWAGYFAFYATGLWLRSRRKPRYLPPVRAYGLALVPFAVALVVLAPSLVGWALPYAPLVATTAWCSARRLDRSLLNDAVTVLAAGLMTAVAYDAGPGRTVASPDGDLVSWAWVWVVTALVTAYFLGTVLYVKTNIRERGRRAYLVGSVGYHVGVAAVVVVLAAGGTVPPWHAAMWVVLVLRAVAVPVVAARRGRRMPPGVLGVGEIVATALVVVTLLVR